MQCASTTPVAEISLDSSNRWMPTLHHRAASSVGGSRCRRHLTVKLPGQGAEVLFGDKAHWLPFKHKSFGYHRSASEKELCVCLLVTFEVPASNWVPHWQYQHKSPNKASQF
jgi:hypothetical protein